MKKSVKKPATKLGIVIGYAKNGIKIKFSDNSTKNITSGVWPSYDAVYPLGSKIPIISNSVSGGYTPKILF